MHVAILPRASRIRAASATFAVPLGLVGGLLLPLVAAFCFTTYRMTLTPNSLENARQLGFVYLAGEVALILYARRDGLDVAALLRALPRWAQAALALFLATFWISSVFVSQSAIFSSMLSFGWIVQLLFAASLYHLVRRRPAEDAAQVWQGFALGLAALTVIIAVHFTLLPAALIGHERKVDWTSAIPGFISARLFGAWAGAILALLTGVAWLTLAEARSRRVVFAAIALAFALTFWTTTRAALLGWVCVFPIAWMFAGKPTRGFWALLLLAVLAGALVTLPLQPYGHPAFSFFDGSNDSADSFSSGRITLWRIALGVAKDYPLLGSGAGSSWWLVSYHGFYHVQPHNAVVQFLLNWGIVPTIPAIVLLAGATFHAHVAARRARSLLPFILMLDCLLVMSMLDGMLHFAQFVMLIFACLAICLAKLQTSHVAHDALGRPT